MSDKFIRISHPISLKHRQWDDLTYADHSMADNLDGINPLLNKAITLIGRYEMEKEWTLFCNRKGGQNWIFDHIFNLIKEDNKEF